MRQILLDTETTGLKVSDGNRIVEIGCVELVNRKLTGNNRHYYINPQRESEPGALAIHGLTTDFLQDKPTFDQIAADFLAYIQGAEVIIHNAPFDLGFLNAEMKQVGHNTFESYVASVLDSLVLAKQQYPGKRNNLDALCDRFGVDRSNRKFHGALLDAQLLADVYIGLTRGQEALLAEDSSASQQESAFDGVLDLARYELPVIAASAQDLEAHEEMLKDLDKASDNQTIWRTMPSAL